MTSPAPWWEDRLGQAPYDDDEPVECRTCEAELLDSELAAGVCGECAEAVFS